MIVVDTSIWIDYFRGASGPHVDKLDKLFGHQRVALGDLILTEIMVGLADETEAKRTFQQLRFFTCFDMVGRKNALQAAKNFRKLRRQGFTIRSTIDVLIGTFCIAQGHSLLQNDKDFIPCKGFQKTSSVW